MIESRTTVAEAAPSLTLQEKGFLAVAINHAPGEQRPWADCQSVDFFVAAFAAESVRGLVASGSINPTGQSLAASILEKLGGAK
jgi:hypothetical protein